MDIQKEKETQQTQNNNEEVIISKIENKLSLFSKFNLFVKKYRILVFALLIGAFIGTFLSFTTATKEDIYICKYIEEDSSYGNLSYYLTSVDSELKEIRLEFFFSYEDLGVEKEEATEEDKDTMLTFVSTVLDLGDDAVYESEYTDTGLSINTYLSTAKEFDDNGEVVSYLTLEEAKDLLVDYECALVE